MNTDSWFVRFLRDVDRCDIPMPNVARDLKTGRTHSFDRISTGVKVLWMLYIYPDMYTYPSQWLGENCYQCLLDIGAEKDIIIFDDSDMLNRGEGPTDINNCHGQFQDFKRGTVYTITPGEYTAWQFADLWGEPDEVPAEEP